MRAALFILMTIAFGASVSARAQPMPALNWQGPYAGLFTAYGFGSDVPGTTDFLGAFNARLSPRGLIAGAFAGHDWRHGNVVLGIEADAALGAIRDDVAIRGPGGSIVANAQAQWLATLRGRVGFAADRALFYATAGLAVGQIRAEGEIVIPALGLSVSSVTRAAHVGYTLGGGAAIAIDDRWSLRAEYLFVDLGRQRHLDGAFDLGLRMHLVRAGLAFRF